MELGGFLPHAPTRTLRAHRAVTQIVKCLSATRAAAVQVTSLRKLNKLICLELIAHAPALATRTTCPHVVLPPLRDPCARPARSGGSCSTGCGNNSAASGSGSGSNDPDDPTRSLQDARAALQRLAAGGAAAGAQGGAVTSANLNELLPGARGGAAAAAAALPPPMTAAQLRERRIRDAQVATPQPLPGSSWRPTATATWPAGPYPHAHPFDALGMRGVSPPPPPPAAVASGAPPRALLPHESIAAELAAARHEQAFEEQSYHMHLGSQHELDVNVPDCGVLHMSDADFGPRPQPQAEQQQRAVHINSYPLRTRSPAPSDA